MWCDNYKHLADVWKSPTTDGIFTRLQAKPDIPWKDVNIPQVLDLTYFYNHSGNKIVSPLIDNMLGDSDTLTEEQKQTLADLVYGICNENWKRVWDVLFSEYNPIWNVDGDIVETETRNLKGTETGSTGQKQTGTDTLGKTGKISTVESGSDSIAHTGTDANVESGQDSLTRTGTDTHAESGTDTKKNSGTDIHALSGTDTQHSTGTQKNENENNGGTQTTENGLYGYNSETPGKDSKSVVTVNQDVIDTRTDDLTQTVEHGQKDTETQDLAEATTYGHTDTETLDIVDTTGYGKTDTRTVDLTDTTEYGKDTSETVDTTDTTTYNNNVDVTRDNTTTDTGTIEHKTVRRGNIGVTTTQQMITEELQLRKEMFYERVFSDIDRYLTIGIY